MKLTQFKIENYRSILNSGWVEVTDIAAIVGKNESGKTSLLKALWKFNPFDKDVEYDIDREFPTGRRNEKDKKKVVATLRFVLSEDEVAKVSEAHTSASGIREIEVQRNYAGDYIYNFYPISPQVAHDVQWVVGILRGSLSVIPGTPTAHFRQQYTSALEKLLNEVHLGSGSEAALERLPKLKHQISSFAQTQDDNQSIQTLHRSMDAVMEDIKQTPWTRVTDVLQARLPVFVYMDDYRIFSGTAQLDEILARKSRKQSTHADDTVALIMEMAGLDLAKEVEKGNNEDRRQRMLDMNDASRTLTNRIANRWSQKKYEVVFCADGQHFETFVKDEGQNGLVPLEDRSKGFQWFFSFDMKFMYETQGSMAGAVILLDEPGLHLHASAQRDLLKRMKAYANGNQLLYSTHLPFMLDFGRLENIHVCEEDAVNGSRVHQNWAAADRDARFTLQVALGLSWSQSLFVGQYNLVVEGVTDFWFIRTFSTLFESDGQSGLDEQLVVTPAGGATKVAYVATILRAQELNVAVLLDSDREGDEALKHLVHSWVLKDKLVMRIGLILGVEGNRSLEDLFDETYYVDKVCTAYRKELEGKRILLEENAKLSVVERIEDAFNKLSLGAFGKGRVAKLIMNDLATKKLEDLSKNTVENFRKLIVASNELMTKWRASKRV